MKAIQFSTIVVICFLFSCTKTTETVTKEIVQIPIYQHSTEKEAEAGLIQSSPKKLTSFGNIYIYKQYLLINERGQGVHIFDNSDPNSPQKISFMNVPGNFDMAIKNDILYVDSYDDLLSLDISSINNIQLLNRTDDVFPQKHPSRFGIIVGYKDTTIIRTSQNQTGNFLNLGRSDDFALAETTFQNSNLANQNNVGTGGSFSRFTLANDHLFTIDNQTLKAFNVSNNQAPIEVKREIINQGGIIETVFPYGDNLFIGSTVGVFIYDISDPASFSFTSNFTHARACDPVYVEDDVAFVTLRSNTSNNCWGVNNQLDILDVADVANPKLTNTYPMQNPHGVGVDGSLLFICEADAGLKIYSLTKTFTSNNDLSTVNISLLKHEKSIFAYDVIPDNGNLIVVGEQQLLQYDYTDPNNITLRSILN
jgi:hypothetical protein